MRSETTDVAEEHAPVANSRGDFWLRTLAGGITTAALLFLLNNYFIFWWEWPGALALLDHLLGDAKLEAQYIPLGWYQLASYVGALLIVLAYVRFTPLRALRHDAQRFSRFAAYIVRSAFWVVLLVGLADVVISFLRVENLLACFVGQELTEQLGRPTFRGTYVHLPLSLAALGIALFVRAPGFPWLALLVVFGEFLIVISRFVFSYEQVFMGDLVRFWYAALFLFASAPALLDGGHVRVDVFYTHFSKCAKAWANGIGSLLLGLPLCWVILVSGMWGRGSSINSPLITFEISQAGYGMFTKYLMAGFLVVFALSMLVQFCGYFLSAMADLRNEPGAEEEPEHPELEQVTS